MADGGAGTAGSKRVRKTAPRFEVDEGRQMGVRDSRSNATNAVPAPASTQAAPHQEGGLVPVSRFLARSLLALSEMQKWHKRVCGGRGVSPDGERTQCECCPREDVLRLDNVVRAVQGTLAAASALPELVGDEGSLQPVEYFVSRETFVALEQAVGGRLELDPSRGGRPASMAKLGKRADELLQVLLPKALGSLPIILSYAGQGGSADAGHCGAGPSGQPSTPATVERPARGAPVTLEQACIATACVDDKPCAFVNHDRSFCAAVLDEVREVAVESVRKHLAARPPGFRHVDDCVRRVLDGEWRAVLPDEKWMHQLLLSMMPALKPGDDNGRARSEARASAILASLVYMHDRRLNHYQLVWAIRCRTTGTSPKMQALLSAHGLALPRRTADTYLSRLCDLLTKRQAEDRRNAGPLIWVVDNYEYMFWKRFLSGALSLYQCATQQDKERLAAWAAEMAAKGTPAVLTGCKCTGGCVGGRCECSASGEPCDTKTCGCVSCRNPVNGLIKAAISSAAAHRGPLDQVDLVMRTVLGGTAAKVPQWNMIQVCILPCVMVRVRLCIELPLCASIMCHVHRDF